MSLFYVAEKGTVVSPYSKPYHDACRPLQYYQQLFIVDLNIEHQAGIISTESSAPADRLYVPIS
jgi:hypothetical protein